MDFEETLAELQGFMRRDVMISVRLVDQASPMALLTLWGPMAAAAPIPDDAASARSDAEGIAGSVLFGVGDQDDYPGGGMFRLSPGAFIRAEWGTSAGGKKELQIFQPGGLLVTVQGTHA